MEENQHKYPILIGEFDFEIKNGLLGMMRDVVIRLCRLMQIQMKKTCKLDSKAICTIMGIGQEGWEWKKHSSFIKYQIDFKRTFHAGSSHVSNFICPFRHVKQHNSPPLFAYDKNKHVLKRVAREFLSFVHMPYDGIALCVNSTWPMGNSMFNGPWGTPYEDGVYFGVIVFPPNYPFAPFAINILTPNGRYTVNVDLWACREQWWPGENVAHTILRLIASMHEEGEGSKDVLDTARNRRKLAMGSVEFNRTLDNFRKSFGKETPQSAEPAAAKTAAAGSPSSAAGCAIPESDSVEQALLVEGDGAPSAKAKARTKARAAADSSATASAQPPVDRAETL